tara:strand:+ start:1071 stop:1304 length:234 start_codon:yes stop_codon:yes gene_type:complete
MKIKMELTKDEAQELLWALYDSETLNGAYASNDIITGKKIKPLDFLRKGNKPVNTVFDKLLDAKYAGWRSEKCLYIK